MFPDEFTGVETARVAARILRGELASDFPPQVIPSGTPTYDWRELKRWGIPESRLPPGSVVLFRQPTVFSGGYENPYIPALALRQVSNRYL